MLIFGQSHHSKRRAFLLLFFQEKMGKMWARCFPLSLVISMLYAIQARTENTDYLMSFTPIVSREGRNLIFFRRKKQQKQQQKNRPLEGSIFISSRTCSTRPLHISSLTLQTVDFPHHPLPRIIHDANFAAVCALRPNIAVVLP